MGRYKFKKYQFYRNSYVILPLKPVFLSTLNKFFGIHDMQYYVTPYHREKITKYALIKPCIGTRQIVRLILSRPWIHLKEPKIWILKNWYLVQNNHKENTVQNSIFKIFTTSWHTGNHINLNFLHFSKTNTVRGSGPTAD